MISSAARRLARWSTVTVVLLLVGSTGACLFSDPTVQVLAEGDYRVTFSSDPAAEILTLTSSGGMTGVVTQYTLHGDGRLIWRWMADYTGDPPPVEIYDGHKVARRNEVLLTPGEIEDLLWVPIRSGLLEIDERVVLKQMGKTSYGCADCGTQVLEFHLTSFMKRGHSTRSPFEFRFAFENLSGAARRFPEIEPLSGFLRLIALMNTYLGLVEAESGRLQERSHAGGAGD